MKENELHAKSVRQERFDDAEITVQVTDNFTRAPVTKYNKTFVAITDGAINYSFIFMPYFWAPTDTTEQFYSIGA